MSSFSFWMTLVPSPPPHLLPSLPFGHIAYKSQAILVSGLPKAWPPGKACRTAVICLIQTFELLSVCLCLCTEPYLHPFMQPFNSLLFCFLHCTQADTTVCLLHHMLASAFTDWLQSHFAFPAPLYIWVYIHTWAWLMFYCGSALPVSSLMAFSPTFCLSKGLI